MALRWIALPRWSPGPSVRSFCNLIETSEGKHLLAVEILDPEWSSPTKDRPRNDELAEVTEAAILAELPRWFEQHPEVLAALLEPEPSR